METVLVSMIGFAVALLALGIGVLCGRRPLRGSCGGVGGQCACGATTDADCREASTAYRRHRAGASRETT